MKDGEVIRSEDVDNVSHYSYCEALRRVLAVRNQRQIIYGDDWKTQKNWELLALMKVKVKRLEHFVIEESDEMVYERVEDVLIDLTNYALFMLQNEIEKRNAVG